MGRKILFITADQMRFDALGCNGQRIARTPVLDRLAAEGLNYTRAHAQNVVCMPARATMITGQYVSTHGVWMNGVPLPADAPSVARELHERKSYRTALIGKAHFEPFLDAQQQFYENQMSRRGEFGPHRGFEHMELATHTPLILHYNAWLARHDPSALGGFYPTLDSEFQVNAAGGGDTGAVQVKRNPVARSSYHTDWVADRTVAWLDSLAPADDFFCWVSFPDPHHPWDPPESEIGRHPWATVPLPEFHPGSAAQVEQILRGKPKHWLEYYENTRVTNYEAPPRFRAKDMTHDQVREINALTHVKNELIDEAVGRILAAIDARGWGADTDVIFTTDHGEFQGEFGLMFKGPYHVDALMRLPMIWRPAKSAGVAPASIAAPVGQIDLAPTFCAIAGLSQPEYMQSAPLPRSNDEAAAQKREQVFTEWDCEHPNGSDVSLRTLHRDGYTITAYGKGSIYAGTEGELYDHRNDPRQWRNLWDDPAHQALKRDLLDALRKAQPPVHSPRMACVAPV